MYSLRVKFLTGIVIFILFVISLLQISRGRFSNDITSLLPLKHETIAKKMDIISAFNTMERVLFEISFTDSVGMFSALSTAATALVTECTKDSLIDFSDAMTGDDFFALRNTCIEYWPQLFTKEDSVWTSKRLCRDTLQSRFRSALNSLFTMSDGTTDPHTLLHDPFGLAQYLLVKLSAFKPIDDIAFENGFITNNARDKILIIGSTGERELTENYCQAISKKIISLATNFKSDNISIDWIGAPRATLDNIRIIKSDVHKTLPITLGVILLICFLIFSRPFFGLLALIPTLLGVVITLALFSFISEVSLIMVGFGAALLGITIDYAIHLLYHYDECREDTSALKTLVRPIVTSALTTAGAFIVLVVAGIPALTQLGMITAVGIFIVAALSLTILPIFFSGVQGKRSQIHPTVWFKYFYKSKLSRALFFPILLIVVILWFFVPKISFEGDPDALSGMQKETIIFEKKISQNWGGIEKGAYCSITANSEMALIEKSEQFLAATIDSLVNKKIIREVSLFTKLLPSKQQQKINADRWKSLFTQNVHAMISSVISEVSAEFGINPKQINNYAENLQKMPNSQYLTIDTFPDSFNKGMLSGYVTKYNNLWYAQVPIIPINNNEWQKIEAICSTNGVLAVNSSLIGVSVVAIIKKGFLKCAFFIPLIMLLILFLMLRDLRLVFIAFFPVICATGMTFGTMALLNIPLNIVTLIVFAFVFGLGVDYTILMIYMGKKDLLNSAIINYTAHGAASVTVAALTTIAGLGVLSLAKHPVLSALGLTGLFGILYSYLCAIILVPQLMQRVMK